MRSAASMNTLWAVYFDCPHVGGDFTAIIAFVLHAYIPVLLPSDFVLFSHTAFGQFGAFL